MPFGRPSNPVIRARVLRLVIEYEPTGGSWKRQLLISIVGCASGTVTAMVREGLLTVVPPNGRKAVIFPTPAGAAFLEQHRGLLSGFASDTEHPGLKPKPASSLAGVILPPPVSASPPVPEEERVVAEDVISDASGEDTFEPDIEPESADDIDPEEDWEHDDSPDELLDTFEAADDEGPSPVRRSNGSSSRAEPSQRLHFNVLGRL